MVFIQYHLSYFIQKRIAYVLPLLQDELTPYEREEIDYIIALSVAEEGKIKGWLKARGVSLKIVCRWSLQWDMVCSNFDHFFRTI